MRCKQNKQIFNEKNASNTLLINSNFIIFSIFFKFSLYGNEQLSINCIIVLLLSHKTEAYTYILIDVSLRRVIIYRSICIVCL